MPATATANGVQIASTSTYEFVEGNVYFPADSISNASTTLTPTEHTTFCPWKGTAHYYDVHADGKVLENAAWYYPEPLPKAVHIKDAVAFYKTKVQIEKEE